MTTTTKIKLFTHIADFDGIACAVLAQLFYGKENVDITYANYDNVDSLVRQYADESVNTELHDYVFITDLSVKEETAKYIESIQPTYFKNGFTLSEKFQLVDHHKSALPLNNHYWCWVEVENDGVQNSATKMFFDILRENMPEEEVFSNAVWYEMLKMVDTVTQLDTWAWKKKNNPEPMKWGKLLKVIGRERFENLVYYKIVQCNFEFNETEKMIIQLKDEQDERYIQDVLKTGIIEGEINGFSMGLIFADSCISEIGNRICESGYDIGAVISFTWRSINFRSIKENVDVSIIAKLYGGGGHSRSSGATLSEAYIISFIDEFRR